MTERIALIGQRSKVLEPLAAQLVHRGYDVRWATSAAAALSGFGAFAPEVLALGRGISQPQRATLVTAFSARQPGLVVVDGLGPNTGLLVAQIEQAIGQRTVLTAGYLDEDSVRVTLTEPAAVEIVEYRFDAFMRPQIRTLADGPMQAGSHLLPIPHRRRRRHLVVRADGEVMVLTSPG